MILTACAQCGLHPLPIHEACVKHVHDGLLRFPQQSEITRNSPTFCPFFRPTSLDDATRISPFMHLSHGRDDTFLKTSATLADCGMAPLTCKLPSILVEMTDIGKSMYCVNGDVFSTRISSVPGLSMAEGVDGEVASL